MRVGAETFVGRRDELARFAAVLAEWAPARSGLRVLRRQWRPGSAGVADERRSPVVLVHGLGGTGKSRLLRQFQKMAAGELQEWPVAVGRIRTAWLDWEDEQRDDPGKYAELEGPSLVTVLDAVQRAVTDAFGDKGPAVTRVDQKFGDYRAGAARMPEYAARFAGLLAPGGQPASGFTTEDAATLLRSALSAGLVLSGHPAGVLGMTPDQLANAGQAGGRLSATAVRAVTGRRQGDITASEYDLVTDPARELTRRVATAVAAAADKVPLVVFLDTGEVIGDRAWGWLRRVMAGTGPRVAWVVGARFETEAEAGPDSPVAQFVRDIGDQYLRLMSPTRFDDEMISAYLASRPGVPSCSPTHIDLIARFTRGLPLAVSFTATLLEEGQPVEEACREIDDGQPSSVVSRLARRYLVHAEQRAYPPDDPRRGDLAKILGLALAYTDLRSDPDLLAAMWDTDQPLAEFEDLSRRHDFVLPVSRRLHEDVLITLRADLLDPYRRASVRGMSKQALGLLTARLGRARRRCPELDGQLEDSEYTRTLLAVLWHTLWLDNQAGLDLLTSMLPILLVGNERTAHAAVALVDSFAGTFTPAQLGHLSLLSRQQQMFVGGGRRRRPTGRQVRVAEISMQGLDLVPPAATGADLIGSAEDRQAALHILRAYHQRQDLQDRAAAIASLQAAAACAASATMRQAIGSEAYSTAKWWVWAAARQGCAPTAADLAVAQVAASMLPASADAWHTCAVALDLAGRRAEALAAYDQAVAAEPGNATFHLNRGSLLHALHRYEDALAAYDQALAIRSGYAQVHDSRGHVLDDLGRHQEAVTAYNQAAAERPGSADACAARGHALHDLRRYEESLAEYDQAVAAEPGTANFHRGRGKVLRALHRYEDALAAYDQALEINSGYAQVHDSRGHVLDDLGRHQEAVAAYNTALARCDQALADRPGSADALADRGHALDDLRRYEESLAAYDQAVAAEPGNADFHRSRGSLLCAMHRYQDALAAYDQALAAEPGTADGHCHRGYALHDLGRFEDAVAAYDQALAADPGNAGVLSNRGDALRHLGRLAEALAAHDQALAIAPTDPFLIHMRGITLAAAGRAREALAACDEALSILPGYAKAHRTRGSMLTLLGRLEEALISHDQALALDPQSAEAHADRGFTLAVMERPHDALAAADQALAISPLLAAGHRARGFALFALGRDDEALAAHDQGLALNPRSTLGHTGRGLVLDEMRRPGEALCAHDQAVALEPNNAWAHTARAWTLLDMCRYPEALAAVDQALALAPDFAAAINLRERTLRQLENPPEDYLEHPPE